MKYLIQYLKVPVIAFLCMTMALLPAFGATVTLSPAAAGTNNAVATAGGITRLTFSGTAATVKVALFDAPTNTMTYIIGAYTNYSSFVYTNSATHTDILGNTVTNAYKYLTNVPTAVIQTTNQYRQLGAFSVPSGETVTIQYENPSPFFQGILVTNNGAISVTVDYLPQR